MSTLVIIIICVIAIVAFVLWFYYLDSLGESAFDLLFIIQILFVVGAIVFSIYTCGSDLKRTSVIDKKSNLNKAETSYKKDVTWQRRFRSIAIYACLAFAAEIAVLIFISIFLMRWRNVRLFISYNNENEARVKDIVAKMKYPGLSIDYLPYQPGERDATIAIVQKKIKACDVAVVLPGNRSSANFTDAEVLTISTLQKVMVILKTVDLQRLPNTAFTGYPSFQLELLEKSNFEPLCRFVVRTFMHISIMALMLKSLFSKVIKSIFAAGLVLGIVAYVIHVYVVPLFIFPRVTVGIVCLCLLFVPFILLFLFIISFYHQYRLANIARQKVQTKHATYNLLKELFQTSFPEDIAVIECLAKDSLEKNGNLQ